MWTRYDQLAKGVVTEELAFLGQAMQEYEIAVEPQKADVWFQPAPGREDERERHGLFGRMAETPCLVEAFHATPSAKEVLACLSKQLNLHRKLLREAARQPGPDGRPRVAAPRLWIVSAGRPERAIRGLELRPMEGWPPGFWEAAPLLHLHLVVLRELPETRETLLLRLLGRGRTFFNAMKELHALPRDAWEAKLAIPLLLAFRPAIPQDFEEDEMRYTPEMQAIYDDWEKRVKHTAWKAGEEAGWKAGEEVGWKAGEEVGRLAERLHLRQSLRQVYEARFGALPPAVQAAIESMEDAGTLQQWVVPFATATPEAIAALVRGP